MADTPTAQSAESDAGATAAAELADNRDGGTGPGGNDRAMRPAGKTAGSAREAALQAELAQTTEELLIALDDIVALANLLRTEEKKAKTLARQRAEAEKIASRVQIQAERDAARMARAAQQLENKVALLQGSRLEEKQARIALATENKALERKLQDAQAEIARLAQQRQADGRQSGDRQARTSRAEEQLQALRQNHDAVRAERTALRAERATLRAEIRSLKAEQARSGARGARGDDTHAALSARILELMAAEKLAFPQARGGGLFGPSNSAPQRWARFCDRLAELDLFDGATYLALHADVAEAQIDPLVHYLTRGQAEKRALKREAGQ